MRSAEEIRVEMSGWHRDRPYAHLARELLADRERLRELLRRAFYMISEHDADNCESPFCVEVRAALNPEARDG